MVEDGVMSTREFRDDDAGYLAWLSAHPDGYVINIARSHRAADARVHHADCRTISGQIPLGKTWTGPYVKVCAERLTELEQWAIAHVSEPIRRCGTCHPLQAPHDPLQPRCLIAVVTIGVAVALTVCVAARHQNGDRTP